ncbi:hypothetical protein BLNAU_4093 [Blattamonas nauphoetae]|uniref:Uncharacterized protein n=1 Tax=Blattamonas nauphoetae TaxID=2049346 RepID=A0ABQ9YB58_9EUKA|nr:hypothetical protein BLNAU_4093 [Blattamonas nauphoetae]
MTSSEKYSPFLKYPYPNYPPPFSDSEVFVSLVSMVRDAYPFDEELLQKTSSFIYEITHSTIYLNRIDDFLKTTGHGSSHPAAGFVDSIVVLLSSSHRTIYSDTLSLLARFTNQFSSKLKGSELIPRILSTPRLRDLSEVDDKTELNKILEILFRSVGSFPTKISEYKCYYRNTDVQALREVMLHRTVIPIEQSLIQIYRHPHLLSWNDEYKEAFTLLSKLFHASAYHQPTLDFIRSSRIPLVFQSLLSNGEDEDAQYWIFYLMLSDFSRRETDIDKIVGGGKILLQALEQEGFMNHLDQTRFHNNSAKNGRHVMVCSYPILNMLGMNYHPPR